ncbi:hypothetical protein GZ22_04465 [Terribacillus saccharophilus]|uniref:DUF58 domain-containing protein n=1 Tax=Terribacillus saccharophilus TaxID=361277 RepID=A0A075LJ55_9BACI|nr:DUF58 domain-containing protein [Terribacillus goriensis]AIF65957.1 hypothetical protein GZ22_04465 [Terribacillus goriensis]
MLWKREMPEDRSADMLIFLAVAAFLLGLWVGIRAFFILAGVIVAIHFVQQFYNKRLGRYLNLQSEQKIIRLFPGEKAVFKFRFENRGNLSLLKANLKFQVTDSLTAADSLLGKPIVGTDAQLYETSFQIPKKQVLEVSLPFTAVKRGLAAPSSISLDLPLFRMQPLQLSYLGRFQTNVIVYPTPEFVQGVDYFFSQQVGHVLADIALTEDPLQIKSIRDYVPTDDFRRIHWKASVRKNMLQTKVLEHSYDMTITLILNISTTSRLGNVYVSPDLERILSCAAFIIYRAAENGYPIDMHINLRAKGQTHIFTESTGLPETDVKNNLDLLASTHVENGMTDIASVLHHLKMRRNQTISILIGELPASLHGMNGRLYHVNPEKAVLEEVTMNRERVRA